MNQRRTKDMNRADHAAEYMKTGFNCAQSIVKAFSALTGTAEDALVRMAAPLGGGIGRNGHVCGALLGAVLILGEVFGNFDPADTQSREKAYEKADRLLDGFRKEHGSVLCRELIRIDMKNPDELQKAREEGVFQKQCPLFVLTAGRLLEEFLE
jgi:C_GCAxxG_C_C family probable redox protein